jgi:hypothetical protein
MCGAVLVLGFLLINGALVSAQEVNSSDFAALRTQWNSTRAIKTCKKEGL